MGEYDFIATKVEIFNAETPEYDTLHSLMKMNFIY